MPEQPRARSGSNQLVAVLGNRDQPTDAVHDYCRLLAEALKEKGRSLELVQLEWAEQGWHRALRDLDAKLAHRRGDWVLVQYTHLAWSRRGFPIRFPRLIRHLKRCGMNVLIVFHDPTPFGGRRLRDRLRRQVQLAAMRRASRVADRVVSSISPRRVEWMHKSGLHEKIRAVPVGSNICVGLREEAASRRDAPTVIVFGFTDFEAETALVSSVLLRVAETCGPLRLIIFGRGATTAESMLRRRLEGSQVHLEAFGILPSDAAGSLFAIADVQLFVRLGVSARRGSAIAGIASGLPVIGFADGETDFPITEAGVRLVALGDADGLVCELTLVLRDDVLRETLRQRSREALRRYFSWESIAEQYLSVMEISLPAQLLSSFANGERER